MTLDQLHKTLCDMGNMIYLIRATIVLVILSFVLNLINAQYSCASATEIQFPIINTTQYIQAPGLVESNESNWFFIEVVQASYLNIASIDVTQSARLSVYKGSCADLSLIAHSAESCSMEPSVAGFTIEMGDIIYLDWQVDCSADAFLFTVRAGLECDQEIDLSGRYVTDNLVNGVQIQSDAQITDQTETVLAASSSIDLNSGFEVELGSMFDALIATCNN